MHASGGEGVDPSAVTYPVPTQPDMAPIAPLLNADRRCPIGVVQLSTVGGRQQETFSASRRDDVETMGLWITCSCVPNLEIAKCGMLCSEVGESDVWNLIVPNNDVYYMQVAKSGFGCQCVRNYPVRCSEIIYFDYDVANSVFLCRDVGCWLVISRLPAF